MFIESIEFSVADIVFQYIYQEKFLLSDDAPIWKFVYKAQKCDVVNHIYFDSNYDYKKFYRKKLITTVPAWSLYNYNGQNVFIFHPQEKEKIVAVLICISGFREVETIILDASFSRQPLPICVTALLLQGILVEREEGLILHGSVIGHNGEGMVLTGNSGVGKTTISKLIIKNSNSYQICDDRFIIKILQDKIYAYGNPFDFKIERVNNNHMELKKLYFLHHADENIVSVVPNNKKMQKLLTISLLPYWSSKHLKASINILEHFINTIEMYDLFFKPTPEIVFKLLE